MKKWIAWMMCALLCLSAGLAAAEETRYIERVQQRLQEAEQPAETKSAEPAETAAPEAEVGGPNFGTDVRIDDPFFAKVRASAYLQEDEYSREANVMIEMKNTSGKTLYPQEVTVIAYDAAGKVIDKAPYASYGPERVDDGESLYAWEWFYGFEEPIAEIAYFEVKVEAETSSYSTYEPIDAEGVLMQGVAYALIENTLQTDIYGLSATMAVEDEDGVLLDVCQVYTAETSGIMPGGTMVLREQVENYTADKALEEGVISVIAQYIAD